LLTELCGQFLLITNNRKKMGHFSFACNKEPFLILLLERLRMWHKTKYNKSQVIFVASLKIQQITTKYNRSTQNKQKK
jgi:hypothetical protein